MRRASYFLFAFMAALTVSAQEQRVTLEPPVHLHGRLSFLCERTMAEYMNDNKGMKRVGDYAEWNIVYDNKDSLILRFWVTKGDKTMHAATWEGQSVCLEQMADGKSQKNGRMQYIVSEDGVQCLNVVRTAKGEWMVFKPQTDSQSSDLIDMNRSFTLNGPLDKLVVSEEGQTITYDAPHYWHFENLVTRNGNHATFYVTDSKGEKTNYTFWDGTVKIMARQTVRGMIYVVMDDKFCHLAVMPDKSVLLYSFLKE